MNSDKDTRSVFEQAQAHINALLGSCAIDGPSTMLNGHLSFDFDSGDGYARIEDDADVRIMHEATRPQLLTQETRLELQRMLLRVVWYSARALFSFVRAIERSLYWLDGAFEQLLRRGSARAFVLWRQLYHYNVFLAYARTAHTHVRTAYVARVRASYEQNNRLAQSMWSAQLHRETPSPTTNCPEVQHKALLVSYGSVSSIGRHEHRSRGAERVSVEPAQVRWSTVLKLVIAKLWYGSMVDARSRATTMHLRQSSGMLPATN